MIRFDVHQHYWSTPLLEALARRPTAPRATRDGDAWTLDLPGEPPSQVAADDAAARSALVRADGLDRALIAPSLALGLERHADLRAAYHEGCRALPEPFGAWGVLDVAEGTPAGVDALLGAGFAGACVSTGALASPARVERLGPQLRRLEEHGAALFVHPGPDPAAPARAVEDGLPGWWPALTDYVHGMSGAWHAWVAAGRARHPGLRVLFAMLAGGAPLHAERLAARGGPADAARDPLSFYDTSSYGPRMQQAVADVVGRGQLVHGSDRPVVEPVTMGDDAATAQAPATLLGTRAAATMASAIRATSSSPVT